jgi:hypothetical protein
MDLTCLELIKHTLPLNRSAYFIHLATIQLLNLSLVHGVTRSYNFGVPTSMSTFTFPQYFLLSSSDRIIHSAVPILQVPIVRSSVYPSRCVAVKAVAVLGTEFSWNAYHSVFQASLYFLSAVTFELSCVTLRTILTYANKDCWTTRSCTF